MAIAKPQKPLRQNNQEFYPLTDSTQVLCDENGTRLDVILGQLSPITSIGYESLRNKPQINSVELLGNKTSSQLGLQSLLTEGNNVSISNDVVSSTLPYGIATYTDSSYRTFVATVSHVHSLEDGVVVLLRNGSGHASNGTSSVPWTLNVNGLGAYPVYNSNNNAYNTTTFANNSTYLFVFSTDIGSSGVTGWYFYTGYDANTNTIGYQLRTQKFTLPTLQKFYRYRLLFMSPDNTHFVPANTSTSTNATASRTVTQERINPFGRIVYYSTTTAIDAGNRPSADYLYDQFNITLGYSFNRTGAKLTMTKFAPVYLKCAPQTDGSVIIDPDTPFTQVLPSQEDGKVYVYLGSATDDAVSGVETTQTMELTMNHPIYWFNGGEIRRWYGRSLKEVIIDCGTSQE